VYEFQSTLKVVTACFFPINSTTAEKTSWIRIFTAKLGISFGVSFPIMELKNLF
jgi:hypothetical protein